MHEDRGPRTAGRGSTVNASFVFGVAVLLVLSAPSSVHAQAPLSPLPRAERLIAANQLDEARRIIDGVLARDPGSASAHYVLGTLLEKQRDLRGAEAAYREALTRDDTMARAHDRLGFVLGQGGATDAAIAEFRRAVALDPRLADAQYHLGATLWWTKQLDDARRALERAVALRPGHAESRYYLGLTKRQQGDLAGAIDRPAPHRGARSAARGRAHAARRRAAGVRRLDGAVEELERAAALDPSRADAGNSLGLALMQKGDARRAIETLRGSSSVIRSSGSRRLNLGNALLQSGDLEGAIEVYRDLSASRARERRGLLRPRPGAEAEGSVRGGGAALRSAQRLDPSMPEAPYTLGVVLWQTGRERGGRRRFSRRHRAPARLRRRPLHARDRPAAARRRRRRARGVPRDDPHQPALAEAYTSIGQLLTAAHDSTGAAEAFANAARLNKVKADSQAAVFAVNAGRERSAAERPARRHRSASARRSRSTRTTHRRTISSGSRLRRRDALLRRSARRASEGADASRRI